MFAYIKKRNTKEIKKNIIWVSLITGFVIGSEVSKNRKNHKKILQYGSKVATVSISSHRQIFYFNN